MAQIKTVALWKSALTGAQGTAGTALSNIISLLDVDPPPTVFSLSYAIASTNGTAGAGTAGSSTFESMGCATRDGNFVSLGTFGTLGNGPAQSGFISFSPTLAPFMKIKAVTGTSNPVVLTAELHMR